MSPLSRLARLLETKENDAWDFYVKVKYDGRFGALKPQHDTRNYNKQVPRCPHGILVTTKCAICDPEGFAALHGND